MNQINDHVFQVILNNKGLKIISLLIAMILWGIVLGSRGVEVTKEIPIEIVTSNDLIASNDVPEKVTFRLSGPKAFLRAILNRPEDPIRVNLTGAKAGNITYRFFADNISLPLGVKVLGVNPPSISLKLEPQKIKNVPVKLEFRNKLPDGYVLKSSEIKPSNIKIRGPESRIDAISVINTVPIDLSEMRESAEFSAVFELSRLGVLLEGQLPRVALDISAIQANFKIKNVDLKVLSSHQAKLDTTSVTVFVRLEPNMMSQLDRTQVYAEVDLSGKNKGRYTQKVKVHLPPKVGLVKVVPDQVKVTLY